MFKLSEDTRVALVVGGLTMAAFWLLNKSPVKKAEQELKKWIGFDENSPNATPLLKKYWAAVNLPPQPISTPWSAAFISTIAAGYLKPSANHIGYARAAWKDRQNQVKGKYWAYRPDEVKDIKKGDIVVKGRSGQVVTWNDVVNDTGGKETHGDIVIENKNGLLSMIGGNVSNSVTKKSYAGLPTGVFTVLRKS